MKPKRNRQPRIIHQEEDFWTADYAELKISEAKQRKEFDKKSTGNLESKIKKKQKKTKGIERLTDTDRKTPGVTSGTKKPSGSRAKKAGNLGQGVYDPKWKKKLRSCANTRKR